MGNFKTSMPPEWVEHEGTIIEWPVKASLIHPENYEEVCQVYRNIVEAVAEFETVYLIHNAGDDLKISDRTEHPVKKIEIPQNESWSRHNGPTYVFDAEGTRYGTNWQFNAWGGKYSPYDLDDAMAGKLLDILEHERIDEDLVMEGGSFHVDGRGNLLSTKECLLNKNRNPRMSQGEIELVLMKRLGVESFIWLENGLVGDETDGHVDNIACFGDRGQVLIQTCKEVNDPNYSISEKAIKTIRNAKGADGTGFKIVELPTPPAMTYDGERLTLSYLNFYFVNGAILLPVFGGIAKETDRQAQRILEEEFPDRKIVPVMTLDLIKEGGNIHCITQQMPLGLR